MLKPTGQFAGDRILIFRGDKDISILLHPVVFSAPHLSSELVSFCLIVTTNIECDHDGSRFMFVDAVALDLWPYYS